MRLCTALRVVGACLALKGALFAASAACSFQSLISQSSVLERADLLQNPQEALANLSAHFQAFPVEKLLALQHDKQISVSAYQKLTKAEIETLFEGNTIYGISSKENGFALYFDKGDVAYLKMADGREEKGVWKVSDTDVISSQWPTIHSGKLDEGFYLRALDGNGFLMLTCNHQAALFVVEKGDPEHLATQK